MLRTLRTDQGYPVSVLPAPYRDTRLSWRAKGVFAWLATATDDELQDVTAALVLAGNGDVDEVTEALDELSNHGYITEAGECTDTPQRPE